MFRRSLFYALTALVLLNFGISSDPRAQEKALTAMELVARHLNSIGSPQARAAIKTRALNGDVQVLFRIGNHGQHDGKFSFLSEGNKIRLGMRFPNKEYAGEQLAYDGRNATTGFIRPRERSSLASVFYQYDYILREGLMCGVASLGWPLLEVQERQSMLDYEGIDNVEGRDLHELRYRSKRGDQGFIATLFFDPETYHLVRAKYQLKIGHLMGPDDLTSARQAPTFLSVLEEFDDYKVVDGVTVPHLYKLTLHIDRKDRSIMTEWTARVQQVFHNRELDPKFFKIN